MRPTLLRRLEKLEACTVTGQHAFHPIWLAEETANRVRRRKSHRHSEARAYQIIGVVCIRRTRGASTIRLPGQDSIKPLFPCYPFLPSAFLTRLSRSMGITSAGQGRTCVIVVLTRISNRRRPIEIIKAGLRVMSLESSILPVGRITFSSIGPHNTSVCPGRVWRKLRWSNTYHQPER
jgi:hypothetical protein